ncbi:hypothetical protein [Pontibacter actiniarum]|uniref:Uncharacterized protein n=1 Tax=Pontibacter actiniarum TaxID=323450 RepID=A0A1X9YPP4_9BACT|nr:hypothetical protein [Pontibacter actiniarum]ARS34843.1 hypothetical protein CA264_04985 [Pontibacter actiniarum]
MKNALLLLVMLAGLLTACEDKHKEPDPAMMGFGYYPLEIGDYRIYQVTDISYKNDVGDTARFQLRERIDTSFTDQTNELVYKVVRSVRPDEGSPWVDDSVYVVSKTSKMLLLTKNNTKFVKLVFPVKEGKTWLGDAYNDRKALSYEPDPSKRSDYYLGKDPYTYENRGASFTVNGETYGNTVTVVQGVPTESWIGLDDRKEVYAEGVGMVYRLYKRIVYCNETESSGCDYAIGFKLYGNERTEELISQGKE